MYEVIVAIRIKVLVYDDLQAWLVALYSTGKNAFRSHFLVFLADLGMKILKLQGLSKVIEI